MIKWFAANKLVLNLYKINVMKFIKRYYFHGFQEYMILKLCTKCRLYKINSLTSVVNHNIMAGPI
jgi:hypothetical protein